MGVQEWLRLFLQQIGGEQLAERLFRASFSSFLVKAGGAALGFGTEVVLARLLPVDEYGTYVYVWAWLNVIGLICTLGFKGALVRFVSGFRTDEKWGHLRGVLRFATQSTMLTSIVLGACVAIGALVLRPVSASDPMYTGMAAGMVALPLLVLNIIRQSALQGLKRVVKADIPYFLVRRVLLVIFVLAWVWAWGKLTAVKTLLLVAVALLLSFLLATYWLRRAVDTRVLETVPNYERMRWIRTAFPFLLISGAALIQSKTDILMLGTLSSSEEAGIYGAATRVTALISFGLNASNMIVAPLISEYYNEGERERLQTLIAIASAGVFAYTVLAGIFLATTGKWVLGIFGGSFVVGYAPMVILILGNTVNALAGPVGYVMTMTGRQWTASKAFGIGAVINIILNATLVPFFGMVGAAVATALSTTIWNVALAYAAWKYLEVNTTVFAIWEAAR